MVLKGILWTTSNYDLVLVVCRCKKAVSADGVVLRNEVSCERYLGLVG